MALTQNFNVDAAGNEVVKAQLQDNSGAAVILGQALAATSLPVTLTALEEGLFGALTETAPASDTASSGLNGRLQRIAQRISSLIALIPTALGQGTMAQSLKVVIASDQSAIPVTAAASATSALSSVASAATTGVLLASNALRKGFTFFNDSNQDCKIAFAATATASAFTLILKPNAFYESTAPLYTGTIAGIWAVANGNMRVTELT